MAVQIILKNSSVEDKRPTANQLANGELSLNYHEDGAFLCCRDTDGNIQQVGGIKVSEDAPGQPVLGSLWFQASTQSLFVHDGTSWLEAASGGGGGGGGTAGVTRLIAADGIDALPSSGTGVVTINADIDTERGLEFVAGEIAVNLGVGLEFNTTSGAIDATSSALQYRGTVDLTIDDVPADPEDGDTYANTGDGAFDTAWVTATGEAAGTEGSPGDLLVWNGDVFTYIPTGGGGGGGGATNLSYAPTEGGTASQGGSVVSSTGTNADIPMVGFSEAGVLDGNAQAGLMSPTDKDKLDGIDIDADGNVTNIAQQQANWDEVSTDEPTFIQNKPTINTNDDGDITNVRVDLGYTAAVDGGTVTNDSGDDASIPFATAANAGLFLEPGTPAATTQFARQVTDAGASSWVAVSAGVEVTEDPPAAVDGDLWWDSSEGEDSNGGRMFIRYEGQWVQTSNVGGGGGGGTAGVAQIVAGTGVTITPEGGTGTVTINSTGGGGGVPEAPIDGEQYARQDGEWSVVAGGGGGVTSITAGDGINVDQTTGDVTISATGGGGGDTFWQVTNGFLNAADPDNNLLIGPPDTGGITPTISVLNPGGQSSLSVGTNMDGQGAQGGGHLGVWYNDGDGASIFTSTGNIRICTDGALDTLQSSITLGGGLDASANNWLVIDSDGNIEADGDITCDGTVSAVGVMWGNNAAAGENYLASNGQITSKATYNDTTATAANLFIASTGVIQRSTSSIRYKTDVQTALDSEADAILDVRPVTFKSLCECDDSDQVHVGFIAEEVAEVDRRLCFFSKDENGNEQAEGVQYDRFVPLLLNLISRQNTRIEALEARLSTLEGGSN